MRRTSLTRQRLTALSLFAATLLTYPLLGLAQGSLAGWPVVVDTCSGSGPGSLFWRR